MADDFKRLKKGLKELIECHEQEAERLQQLKNSEKEKYGLNIDGESFILPKENKHYSVFFSEQEISELKSELEKILGEKHSYIKIDFFDDGLIEDHTLKRKKLIRKIS